jgi:hypothetical protein
MGVAVIYYLTVVIVVVVLAWIILTGYRFHRKACNYRDRLERMSEGGPCPPFPECNCGSRCFQAQQDLQPRTDQRAAA